MAFIQWNLRGLRNNREQIRVLMRDHNALALCMQETKLGDTTPNFGRNFSFFRSPPMIGERAQGGTGILISKSLNHREIQIDTALQANAVQIFVNKWITLCSVYLDPDLERRLLDASGLPRQLTINDLQSL